MKALVRLCCSMLLVLCSAQVTLALPLSPSFSYQGQLILNGNPVNGIANLRFSLWDAAGAGSPPSGGTQIGASQIIANVPVTNGLFVVQLNDANQFGVTPFNGDARWLQVEVCTDGTCSTVTTLSPRQPVLATPYALMAKPWQLLGGNVYFMNGNVGIGTSAPTAQLSLGSNNANSKLLLWDDGSSSGLGFGVGPNQFRFHLGLPANRFSFLDGPAGNELVTIQGNGNMGIGTNTPAERLTVVGNISLGPNGEFDALAGEEKLRIIRGLITGAGTPARGCCYSVTHLSTGLFQINFTRPFSDAPIVVATAIIHPNYDAVCRVIANDTGFATIEVKNGSDLVDWSFHFIVAGPSRKENRLAGRPR
jgi:hypothetical protein